MSSSSRNLIVNLESKLLVSSYNIQTHQCTDHGDLKNLTTPAQIFAKLQSFFNLNQVKAIIFSFHGNEYPTLKKQYEFYCECRQFCQKNGIFYYFPYTLHNQTIVAISQTKTMVKEGEKVLILSLELGLPPMKTVLIRKKDCYEIETYDSSLSKNIPSPYTKEWEEDMIKTLKPAKIILRGSDSKNLEKAQHFLKSCNPVVSHQKEFIAHYLVAIANRILFLMDGKVNQYNVTPPSWWTFEVRLDKKSLIKTTPVFTTLPFEQSVDVVVYLIKRVSLFCNFLNVRTPEMFEEIKLSTFKCKKVTVTLKLDYNSFYEFKVEPFEEAVKKENKSKDNVADKPVGEIPANSTADDKPIVPEKARMVFDKQNFAVSCFANGKEYGLNDSEGSDKTPIYIAFTEKKPIIGKGAMEIYSEKPSFVVFDLIKLCSISTTDIEDPKWGFSLSKEEESIMVVWETPEEKQKQTVEFLLALIIKNGKDRIKKEYGKRITEIKIGFDGFVPNDVLKKNFVEAGKLLKIDVVFV